MNNGDSLAVKRSAATQIGQIVTTNPKEIQSILDKVRLTIGFTMSNIIEIISI